MRYFYPLVACIGLCAVPSLGRAAPAADRASQSASSLPPAARVPQSPRADDVSVGSDSRAADDARDMARYAQREAQSPAALEYRGGNTIVIGTTAAVIILAVVLIIVLL